MEGIFGRMAQLPLCAPVHVLIYASPNCDRRIVSNRARGHRAQATCRAALPHDEPAKNAVFLRSGALKPGIILPLSYKTAHFLGLAAVFRVTFLMTIVILIDR
jgi:hypothetical protein